MNFLKLIKPAYNHLYLNNHKELGIKDLDNLDKIVDEKKQAFELKLKELKEVLDNTNYLVRFHHLY